MPINPFEPSGGERWKWGGSWWWSEFRGVKQSRWRKPEGYPQTARGGLGGGLGGGSLGMPVFLP